MLSPVDGVYTVRRADNGAVDLCNSATFCTDTATYAVSRGGTIVIASDPSGFMGSLALFGGCDAVNAAPDASPACNVTMNGNRTVDLDFRSPLVHVTAQSGGTVTSSRSPANCSTSCDVSVPFDNSVTLTAQAVAGSAFAGWTGECAASGAVPTCVLSNVRADLSVGAKFGPTLSIGVGLKGTGHGSVASDPIGMQCPGACSALFPLGTSRVVLTATAAVGSQFVGWSGDCAASGANCVVTAGGLRSVTAEFESKPPPRLVITSASFHVAYSVSRARGSFEIQGHAEAPGAVAIRMESANGGMRFPRFVVHSGSFSRTFKVPASALPGRYSLVVSGTDFDLAGNTAPVTLPSPPTGVVSTAWIASVRNGPPTVAVRSGRSAFYAYFRLATAPRHGHHLTVAIYAGSALWATVGRPTGPLVWVIQPIPPTLRHRTWHVRLFAGKDLLKQASIVVT